jgi:hypothetical protein
MSPETRAAALARDGHVCRCGCGRRATQVHHIFKRERWPLLADEIENLIAVAPLCHMRHEVAFQRLASGVIQVQAERVLAKVRRDGDGYLPSMRSYLMRSYSA